jgi:hypothetical protein
VENELALKNDNRILYRSSIFSFLFKASRGKFDAGVETEEEMDASLSSRIPVESDILYAFSTAEG